MHALLTFYPRDSPSTTALLKEGQSPYLGRNSDNDIPIVDSRVSSRHARFQWRGTSWWLQDLGSKNGTFLNGSRVTECELMGEDWISLGGLPAHCVLVSEDALSTFLADRASKRRCASEVRVAMEKAPDARDILTRLVDSAVDVAAAERGFAILVSADGTLVAGSRNSQPTVLAGRSDLRNAVDRVLSSARPFVAASRELESTLTNDSSGRGAFACIPLRDVSRVIGLLYLEGKNGDASFSEMDVEILEALANRATIMASKRAIGLMDLTSDAALGALATIEEGWSAN